jgi:hypothetical protein
MIGHNVWKCFAHSLIKPQPKVYARYRPWFACAVSNFAHMGLGFCPKVTWIGVGLMSERSLYLRDQAQKCPSHADALTDLFNASSASRARLSIRWASGGNRKPREGLQINRRREPLAVHGDFSRED